MVKRDKEGLKIMTKESIHQEDITFKIYVPNREAPKYIKQILADMKGKLDYSAILVWDFNTTVSAMDISFR